MDSLKNEAEDVLDILDSGEPGVSDHGVRDLLNRLERAAVSDDSFDLYIVRLEDHLTRSFGGPRNWR